MSENSRDDWEEAQAVWDQIRQEWEEAKRKSDTANKDLLRSSDTARMNGKGPGEVRVQGIPGEQRCVLLITMNTSLKSFSLKFVF